MPYQVFLRHATQIDGLVVTAKETTHLPFYLRDFEERMDAAKYSGAKAFTPSEFRKKDGLRLIDVLKDKAVGDKTQRCAKYLIYRDGVSWDPPELEAFTAGVPKEDADNFEAAMFYTLAQLPLDIAHTSMSAPNKRGGLTPGAEVCGVLLSTRGIDERVTALTPTSRIVSALHRREIQECRMTERSTRPWRSCVSRPSAQA